MGKRIYETPLDEMVTWPGVRTDGFTADTCGKCRATVNVMANTGGWHCPNCESFNMQSCSGHQIPHENPDYGPTRAELEAAYRKRDGGLK